MEINSQNNILDEISKYFTDQEWNDMSYHRKSRIEISYKNYMEMKQLGINTKEPDFMLSNKENKQQNTEEKETKVKKQYETRESSPKTNNTSRYPKRNIPTKDYTEEEMIPDDYYVYCDICMNEYVHKCNIHEQIFIPDNPIPVTPKNPKRARETAPKGWVHVSSSKIIDGGEGVWALKKLRLGIRFGPYEGVSNQFEVDGRYSWQVKKNGKVINYIDGSDTSKANWMRYVNCARNIEEQNLMAYQYKGKIYYRTVVDISPGTELLVFYGSQFAKELGIDTKKFNSPPTEPLQDNIFVCQICKLGFSSPIYLENHNKRCNKTSKKDIKPRKQFKPNSLSVVDINNDNEFKCDLCHVIYTIKSMYDRHLMVKHCIYNKNPEVQQNNGDANNNSSANSTMDSGYNDADFELIQNNMRHKCTFCPKAFKAPSHLKMHIRIHTGERPYSCEICKKKFTQLNDLKIHNRIHTGERPYTCEICKKKFTQLSHLQRHNRIHTGERPYTCEICKKKFTESSHLKKHNRIHTGERPYTCEICKKKFTQLINLKRHKKIHARNN